MNEIRIPVTVTSIVLFIYMMLAVINAPYPLIMTFFLTVNILLVWMVYKILTKGKPSKKRFNPNYALSIICPKGRRKLSFVWVTLTKISKKGNFSSLFNRKFRNTLAKILLNNSGLTNTSTRIFRKREISLYFNS